MPKRSIDNLSAPSNCPVCNGIVIKSVKIYYDCKDCKTHFKEENEQLIILEKKTYSKRGKIEETKEEFMSADEFERMQEP